MAIGSASTSSDIGWLRSAIYGSCGTAFLFLALGLWLSAHFVKIPYYTEEEAAVITEIRTRLRKRKNK